MYITKKPPHTKYDCNQLLSICDWIEYSHIETHVTLDCCYIYLLSHSQEISMQKLSSSKEGRKSKRNKNFIVVKCFCMNHDKTWYYCILCAVSSLGSVYGENGEGSENREKKQRDRKLTKKKCTIWIRLTFDEELLLLNECMYSTTAKRTEEKNYFHKNHLANKKCV